MSGRPPDSPAENLCFSRHQHFRWSVYYASDRRRPEIFLLLRIRDRECTFSDCWFSGGVVCGDDGV